MAVLFFQEELIGDAGWAAQVTVPLAGDPKVAVHGVAFLRNLATCVPLKVSTPMMALRCASRHCHHCTCTALHCTARARWGCGGAYAGWRKVGELLNLWATQGRVISCGSWVIDSDRYLERICALLREIFVSKACIHCDCYGGQVA